MEEISHIGAIDTVRVLANDERLRLLRLLMRGPATLTQLGAVGRPPSGVGAAPRPESRAGRTGRARRDPSHQGLRGEVLLRHGARLRGGLHGAAGRGRARPARHPRQRRPGAGHAGAPAARGRGGPEVVTMAMGSLEGLIALRHGAGHVAGCHLFDSETDDFNRSYARALFPGRSLVLITLAHRQQGLIVPTGNPRGLEDLAGAVSAGARLVNRNRGSGHARLARPAARRRRRGPRPRRRLRGRGDDARRRGAGGRRGRRRRRSRHPAGGERARPRLRPSGRGALRPRHSARALRERAARAAARPAERRQRSSRTIDDLEAT